jgi:acetyl esterase/lipase
MQQERVFFELDGMESAVVQRDQRWPGSHLVFDVYSPPERALRPVVLFVHGDAPPERLQNMKEHPQYTSWGRLVAASGLVAVTFNRRSTEGGSRATEAEAGAEVRTMLEGLRDRGDAYGIDGERLGVWVCSAGPPTVVPMLLRERPSCVHCLVVYYGLLDVPDAPRYSAVATLEDAAEVHATLPMLIVRAGQDRPHFLASIDRFIAVALSRNVPFELINHAEGEHAFEGRTDTPRTREAIARTLDFLRWHLTA